MKKLLSLLLIFTIISCQTDIVQDIPIKVEKQDNKTITYYENGDFEITTVDDFNEDRLANVISEVAAEVSTTAVTTVFPTSAPGNADSYVTITAGDGVHFGTDKFQLKIYFGSYLYNSGIITEISDTRIVTQVPVSNSGNYTIKITDLAGVTITTVSLSVPWGVYTATNNDGINGFKRYPFAHVDLNGFGGETLHCPIGTPESFKSTIRQAIQWWNERYGYNITLGEDVNATISNTTDGIMMVGIEAGAGLGRASVRATNCGDNTFYISDGYFSFDSSPSVAVAAHELGHFFGHGHSSAVMCATTSCLSLSTNSNIDAASNYIMDKSVNVGVSCYPLMTGEVQPPPPTVYRWYIDGDLDGYGNPDIYIDAVKEPAADFDKYILRSGDCDDTDFNVNPGKTEIIGNGIDDDCNPRTKDTVKGKGGGGSGGGKPKKN